MLAQWLTRSYIQPFSPVLLGLLVLAGQPPAVDGVVGAVPGRGGHIEGQVQVGPGISLDGVEVEGGQVGVRVGAVEKLDDAVIFPHLVPAGPQPGPLLLPTLEVETVGGPGAHLAQLGLSDRLS